MQVSFIVDIEVDDDYVALTDTAGNGMARGIFAEIVRTAITNVLGNYPGIVTEFHIEAHDGGETGGSGSLTTRPAREFGDRGVVVASAPRTAPRSDTGKRMGRPKTLTDMEASDGGAVRAWGDRSPESLHTAGISTRPVGGNEDWTPPRARKTAKSAAPVVKGYKSSARPVVVSKQRGK
jgi:hypothetical protein